MAKAAFLTGAAAVPISPQPQHLQGRLYLGGYDGYLGRPAQGVHDDLHARAFVLTHGDDTVALVVLDLVGMANSHIARIRRAAARRLAIPEGSVLVACTHSHASPDLQGLWGGVPLDYKTRLIDLAAGAVANAYAARRPGHLRDARPMPAHLGACALGSLGHRRAARDHAAAVPGDPECLQPAALCSLKSDWRSS